MLGYTLCLADPDLCIRKAVNDDRCEYYKYMLLYVDNFICVSGQPIEALEKINKYFPIKTSLICPPNIYLGKNVGKVQLPNVFEANSIITSRSMKESVKTCRNTYMTVV